VLRSRHAGEDQSVEVAARAGNAEAVVVILELHAPVDLAGLLIESDEAAVELAAEDHALTGRHATVVPAATDQVVDLRDIREILPQLAPGLRVEGEDVVVAGRDVHDPVDDERVGLEDVLRAAAGAEASQPGALQPLDVARVDLV